MLYLYDQRGSSSSKPKVNNSSKEKFGRGSFELTGAHPPAKFNEFFCA